MPAAQGTQTASNYILVAEPSLGLNTVTLQTGLWTIGAASTNRIVVPAPGIADQHCLILARDGQLLLTSQGGQTRVNGSLVSEIPLRAGDVLTLGDTGFQIRQEWATADSDNTPQGTSISARIEALTDLAGELDREFVGQQSGDQQLETAIEQLQAGLETNTESQDTAPVSAGQTASKQSGEFQQTLTVDADSVATGSEPAADNSRNDMADDPRIQDSQHTLDQIAEQFEQAKPALSDARVEQQLSTQIEQQVRRLESVSRALQSRAELLDKQAMELDRQRSRLTFLEEASQQDSGVSANSRSGTGPVESGEQPLTVSAGSVPSPGTDVSGVLHHSTADVPTGSLPEMETSQLESPGTGDFEYVTPPSEPQAEYALDVPDEGPVLCQTDTGLLEFTSGYEEPAETDSSLTSDDAASMEDALHSYVNEQRRKLRSLMEEFQPCLSVEADETEASYGELPEPERAYSEDTDSVENRAAVMAEALTHHDQCSSIITTERSGNTGIHQLDNPIRASGNEGHIDVPSSKPPEPERPGDGITLTSSDFSAISGARVSGGETVAAAETNRNQASTGPLAADSIDDTDQDVDGHDHLSDTASVEATIDFAAEQLTAMADAGDLENDPAAVGFETEAAESAVSSDLTVENITGKDPEQGRQDAVEINAPSDLAVQPPEAHVHELRNQLAQMFDIQGSETQENETEQAPHLTGTEHEAHPPEAEHEAHPPEAEQISNGPDDVAVNPDSEEEPADFQNPFELPHDTEHNAQTASPSSMDDTLPDATELDTENTDDDDSEVELTNREAIREYMEALLARNRRQLAGDEDEEPLPDESPPEPAASGSPPSEQPPSDSVSEEVQADAEPANRSWLTEGPRHSQDRVALRASLATLREVANETARFAMAQSSQTQLRREILTLSAASLICLGFAIAATLLMNNPLLPLGAVGLGLYFAVRMGLLMRCSWGISRHARRTSDSISSSSRQNHDPDNVVYTEDQE